MIPLFCEVKSSWELIILMIYVTVSCNFLPLQCWKQLLPASEFVGDGMEGFITLNVSPRDTRNLARFFYWLEASPDAAVVKEWSISNTSLQSVFLMLCVQSKEVRKKLVNKRFYCCSHKMQKSFRN